MLYLTKPISIPIDKIDDHEYVTSKLYKHLRARRRDFLSYTLHKRSIDARNKDDVHYVCSYVVDCAVPPQNAAPYVKVNDVFDTAPKGVTGKCVVIGAGPAGLFAALYLSHCGMQTTVVERGLDVIPRKQAVDAYFSGGAFNPRTNVQFGLGGAGAFSDGKLTSNLASTELGQAVFNQLVDCGAPHSILYDALPHVGTDNLVTVVSNLRDKIKQNGGTFLFDTKVVDLVVNNGVVNGVTIEQDGATRQLNAYHVILVCGHSARDTFEMLSRRGADMQFKPFAVGARIEHTREFINTAQYGKLFATHRDLGAATYKLTHNCRDGHGCYSFCMCPGGIVVAANSESDAVVVNGMSNYARSAVNSNSALVVTVNAQDVESLGYGSDVFAGMRFQEDLERAAFVLGGGNYVAPCQNVTDFIANKPTTSFDVTPSYPRGVTPCNLRVLLPEFVADNLAEALLAFDNKIRGFGSSGVLTAAETRTSSPVKITRGETYQSNLRNLYPIGEGAGYAGGIVSAAVDGLRAAMSIVEGA